MSSTYLGLPIYSPAQETINTFHAYFENLIFGMIEQKTSAREMKSYVKMLNYLIDIIFFQLGISPPNAKFSKFRFPFIHKKPDEYAVKNLQNLIRQSLKSIVDAVINLGISQKMIDSCDYSVYIDFEDGYDYSDDNKKF